MIDENCIADDETLCECKTCKAIERRFYEEWLAAGRPSPLVKDDGDEIEVCSGCKSEVRGIGEDGISFCDECEVIVEGSTERMTEKEYEEYHG